MNQIKLYNHLLINYQIYKTSEIHIMKFIFKFNTYLFKIIHSILKSKY